MHSSRRRVHFRKIYPKHTNTHTVAQVEERWVLCFIPIEGGSRAGLLDGLAIFALYVSIQWAWFDGADPEGLYIEGWRFPFEFPIR